MRPLSVLPALVAVVYLSACASPASQSLTPRQAPLARSQVTHTVSHVLFVSNEQNNTVAELDATSGKTVRVFTGVSGPVGAAVVPGGKKYPFPILYVNNDGSNDVSWFDATTGKAEGAPATIGGRFEQPRGMAYDGTRLYTANDQDSTVVAFTPCGNAGACFRYEKRYDVTLSKPQGLKIDKGLMYVANAANNSLSVISTSTGKLAGRIINSGLEDPEGVGINDGKVFVSSAKSNEVTVFDQTTLKPVGRIAANGLNEPLGMAVGNGTLYVTDYKSNQISMFDTKTNKPKGVLSSPAMFGPVDVFYY
jgi:DNA-binding beta-propeller fold protein YncE